MHQLQELIRAIDQVFVSLCQHLAHFGTLQILQPVVPQQGALKLQQDLLSLHMQQELTAECAIPSSLFH